MSKTSKVMLWSLGDSISFSFLSWKAKIAWPCVISGHDEQGRFLAVPNLFKGTLCSLVNEIQEEDVPGILTEFEEQGMIVTYESDGLLLGQAINHWKYNKPPYAGRSKYAPPPGWTDRIHEKDGTEHILENWDSKGGFATKENSIEENSIEEYREDKGLSSSSDGEQMGKTSRKQPDTPHHRVVAGYIERIAPGYAKRYPGKFKGDLAKIKAMLNRGHSEEDILACYDAYKSERFWASKHLSMKIIDENIDDWRKAGGKRGSHQRRTSPRRREAGELSDTDKRFFEELEASED